MQRLVALIVIASLATVASVVQVAHAQDKDSEKAAATKKALDAKISVEYKEAYLKDVIDDLKDKIKAASKKDVNIIRDPTGAASGNMKISYDAKTKPASEVIAELCKKNDLTFSVISGKYKTFGTKYDGFIFINK